MLSAARNYQPRASYLAQKVDPNGRDPSWLNNEETLFTYIVHSVNTDMLEKSRNVDSIFHSAQDVIKTMLVVRRITSPHLHRF